MNIWGDGRIWWTKSVQELVAKMLPSGNSSLTQKWSDIQNWQREVINRKEDPKSQILAQLNNDTHNKLWILFSDEHKLILVNILFDKNRENIYKYINAIIKNNQNIQDDIQAYVELIKDEKIKIIFERLKNVKELELLKKYFEDHQDQELNIYNILVNNLHKQNTREVIDQKDVEAILEKNFREFRNNLYKYFEEHWKQDINYWIQFIFIKSFDGKELVIYCPRFLAHTIEADIDNNKRNALLVFILWIRKQLDNENIKISYDCEIDDFLFHTNKNSFTQKEIFSWWSQIKELYDIPQYHIMQGNGFDNQLKSKDNKIKFLIMQNIKESQKFWLKLYKWDIWFLYSYLNHLAKFQWKRSAVINAKDLASLYWNDFNPNNKNNYKKTDFIKKNIDILVIEDSSYFRNHAEWTRKRLKSLNKTVIFLWNQSSEFENPFGDLCNNALVYDLPRSNIKSQKWIFMKIYEQQKYTLFPVELSDLTIEFLVTIIAWINRNYWNIKSVLNNFNLQNSKVSEYKKNNFHKFSNLNIYKWNLELHLSQKEIGEISLFLKISWNKFDLLIDEIDECMNEFYGIKNIADTSYNQAKADLLFNVITKEYPTDLLWISMNLDASSKDAKAKISEKYKVTAKIIDQSIFEIIWDIWLTKEFVHILNKKIIEKYYKISIWTK